MNRSWLGLLLALPFASGALAHSPSDSYLSVRGDDAGARVQWEIALRDLELLVGLDIDGDGAITWGELRTRRADVLAHAVTHLLFRADGAPCELALPGLRASERVERGYAVLDGTVRCTGGRAPDALEYLLLFEQDPTHRVFLSVSDGETTRALVLDDRSREASLPAAPGAALETFARFWREGVWHVWIGIDHVLFLVVLLLPAAVGHGAERPGLRRTVVDAAKIVTAFTVAHSFTLALAVLEVVSLPARLVESAIALTVLLAAVDNLRRLFGAWRARVAFGLGLVHGLGFAGALQALGLPPLQTGLALGAFNLGVECGQLALVCAVLPVAWAVRDRHVFRRVLAPGLAVGVAAVAMVWLVERSLDLRILPAIG